jgi:HrpA-like RNA helicase
MAIMGEESPHDIEVLYLEDVMRWMGTSKTEQGETFMRTMKELPASDIAEGKVPGGNLMDEWLQLIANFVWCIHERQPLTETVIIFLPTYKLLEQLHSLMLLKQLTGGERGAALTLHVLHSSVDTADALSAMRGAGLGRRSVLLASNVAESSVTIPNLAWVVDSCLHNLVEWDPSACNHGARVAWAAKAQSEQRMGRTGRTCSGRCARMLPKRLYDSLPPHERPQVRRGLR